LTIKGTPAGEGLESSIVHAKSSVFDLLLLAGFCAYLFYFGLGYFGLIGADEPRYAQVAREMLARHDWITPILGGTPWLEKPVLYYWQAMLAYSVFGVSDWASRLPSAIDATLMVVAVYFFLRRFRPGFQLDGALITSSMAGVIGFARAASMDMPLAATFTIAMLAWWAWYESGRKRYLLLFYLCIAFGTLAKGPVAPLLAGLIIVIFAKAKGDVGLVWRTLWIPGILVFCGVALPWYAAVQLRNPEFFRTFILEHNLARFGTNLYRHQQPFWYYIPIMLLALIPWTVFVGAALVENIRSCWAKKRAILDSRGSLDVFLVIWLIAPVLFFSISESKLPGYILPALPPGTLLLAQYVRPRVTANQSSPITMVIFHSILAALTIVPALMLPYLVTYRHMPWGRGTTISAVFAVIIAAGMTLTLRHGLRTLRFVTLVPVVLALAVILRLGAPALDAALSARPLANEISHIDNQTLPVAAFRVPRETEYGLAFYRNSLIGRYEWGQIPATEHIVVAPQGAQTEVAAKVPGRRVSYLGRFIPQKLDYFWVAAKGVALSTQ